MLVWADLETYCETPIKHGSYRYAEAAEVLLCAWAVGEEPVRVEEGLHPEFVADIAAAETIVFHNSMFDRTVLRHRGIDLDVTRIEDTMVMAYAHGLPGSLDMLCEVLDVPVDKSKGKDGKKLIQLFSKPRPKNAKLRRATKETHPDEWSAFVEYARRDVAAMRDIHARLPRWNHGDSERRLWWLDQAINDRGVAVDLELAGAALGAFQRASRSLADAAGALTGGAVTPTTRRAALLEYLENERGVVLADMQKGTVEAALTQRGDLDPVARALLENRQQAAATSPAKYDTLLKATSSDGRLRGTLQFCGAARTGRDCLAEGTLVATKSLSGPPVGKPIEKVLPTDLVWDGEQWVRHEGVVFSGEKEVITHDSVVATEAHLVYVSDTECLPLGEARSRGLSLWQGKCSPCTG